jgi:hypothetical protein
MPDIVAITELAVQGIEVATKMATQVISIIQHAGDASQADKDACISKIKAAQTAVPEWQ